MPESTLPGHESATIPASEAAKFLVDQWSQSGFNVSASASAMIEALIPYTDVKTLAGKLLNAEPKANKPDVSGDAAVNAKGSAPILDAAHAASSLLLAPKPEVAAVATHVPVKRTVCGLCGKVHLENSRCS